jgi:hypothetical protein
MSWLSGLSATIRPIRGMPAGLVLGHVAERKAQEIDLLLRGGEQEIALVAVGVGRSIERAMCAVRARADVVTGRQHVGVEVARGLQEIGELDRLVAGDTGYRGFAGKIGIGEVVDHRLAEAAFIVEHVMGNAQRLADAARIVDILAGAAGAGLAHRFAMIVELQRDADDLVALGMQQAGHDGGIDAAGHGDDDTRLFWRLGDVERIHGVSSGNVRPHIDRGFFSVPDAGQYFETRGGREVRKPGGKHYQMPTMALGVF